MTLPTLWFFLLGVLLTGYAVLDGFDLGVGVLHLFARGDRERRILLNAIGPVWDGNEVWLVTFGGALFAAFPDGYAAAFSAFYLPFMLLLFALLFRAVSIEFRSKAQAAWWRASWDIAFCASSTAATSLMGVAVGNSIAGIPLGPDGVFEGSVSDLLRPYPLAVGALAVVTSALHGATYLELKTEGELLGRVKRWALRAFFLFLALYTLVSGATLWAYPHVTRHFADFPVAWVIVFLHVLAIANVPRALLRSTRLGAFVSTGALVAALVFLFGAAMFPYLVRSTRGEAFSLTITSAASSPSTLKLMLVVAALGMPFVVAYTFIVYWVFRGKVKLSKHSY
jgi:cytochrome d ubiquinol oxidase subunit II